jgi:hypothetical protein
MARQTKFLSAALAALCVAAMVTIGAAQDKASRMKLAANLGTMNAVFLEVS